MRAKGHVGHAARRRRRHCLQVDDGVAKMMTVIVAVLATAGLTVSEKKTETMLLRARCHTSQAPLLVIESAGERYRQTIQHVCLEGVINESAALVLETSRRIRLMHTCLKWFGPELSYDTTTTPLSQKVRMLKVEVIETLRYGCLMCTLSAKSCRQASNRAPSPPASNWLPAPTKYRLHHPLERQGPQEDTMRGHRNGNP